MAIVLIHERPALRIRDGSFDTPPDSWRRLEDHRNVIDACIPSVGRLESNDQTFPFLATAFLVGNGLALTTKHVAKLFSIGMGDRDVRLEPKRDIWINLKAEYGADTMEIVPVTGVAFIHPYWDVAALRVDTSRTGLVLEHRPASQDSDIAIIGYPAEDMRNDKEIQRRIFGSVFNVKCLLPGKLQGEASSPGGHEVAITHDASTLGGTAGAPVIDIRSGRVLGVQFAGIYLQANYAVPSWELMNDSRVRHHLGFAEPHWMNLWDNLPEELQQGESPTSRAIPEQDVKSLEPYLTHDQVIGLCRLLIKAFPDDERTAVLYRGIPPELVGALPGGANPKEKLLNRLIELNTTGLIGDQSPLFVILNNAVYLREMFPEHDHLKDFLRIVEDKDKELKLKQ